MTVLLIVLVLALAMSLAAVLLTRRRLGPAAPTAASARRVLFPFVGDALSQSALDAALRIARAEGATLVPAFLARVPMNLPLDTALPYQCDSALPLLEAIEQQATVQGIPVDSRIERGRTARHAVRELVAHERYDRMVVAAATNGDDGFRAADIAWLLDHAPGDLVILRPGGGERVAAAPATGAVARNGRTSTAGSVTGRPPSRGRTVQGDPDDHEREPRQLDRGRQLREHEQPDHGRGGRQQRYQQRVGLAGEAGHR
jgi:hypothetical protein